MPAPPQSNGSHPAALRPADGAAFQAPPAPQIPTPILPETLLDLPLAGSVSALRPSAFENLGNMPVGPAIAPQAAPLPGPPIFPPAPESRPPLGQEGWRPPVNGHAAAFSRSLIAAAENGSPSPAPLEAINPPATPVPNPAAAVPMAPRAAVNTPPHIGQIRLTQDMPLAAFLMQAHDGRGAQPPPVAPVISLPVAVPEVGKAVPTPVPPGPAVPPPVPTSVPAATAIPASKSQIVATAPTSPPSVVPKAPHSTSKSPTPKAVEPKATESKAPFPGVRDGLSALLQPPQGRTAAEPPVWPGLGVTSDAALASSMPSPPITRAKVNPLAGQTKEEKESKARKKKDKKIELPPGSVLPRPRRRVHWALGLTLLAGLALGAFYWLNPRAILKFSVDKSPSVPKALPLETPRNVPAATPVTPEPAVEHPIEMRRAVPATPATPPAAPSGELKVRAQDVVHVLETSPDLSQKLAVIWGGEGRRTEVERFFSKVGPSWRTEQIEPGATVTELDSGVQCLLFRVATSSCAKGAVLHLLRNPAGVWLMDWPLFAESHNGGDGGLEGRPWEQHPIWRTVIIQRSATAPAEQLGNESYESVQLQGISPGAGTVNAYVRTDSGIGHLLSTRLSQNQLGLAKLLLAVGNVGGRRVPVVEDYETARTAQR